MATPDPTRLTVTQSATTQKPPSIIEGIPLLHELMDALLQIRDGMMALETEMEDTLHLTHPRCQASARNLVHYLALRRRDIRGLQEQLAELGLSSLGRSECHVMGNLIAVFKALNGPVGDAQSLPSANGSTQSIADARALLEAHAEALLGPRPAMRGVSIMVTMPTEAATSYAFVRNLLEQGMDCARINCAYDDPEVWDLMIRNIRRAQGELGKNCRVAMDLAGPKLRTGPMEPGPQIVTWGPTRDVRGNITAPARIWLTPAETPESAPKSADAWLPIDGAWLTEREVGDRIWFTDLRGKKRYIEVLTRTGTSWWAIAKSRAYVEPGTRLRVDRKTKGRGNKAPVDTTLSALPPREQAIVLSKGDALILTRELLPGAPAAYDPSGTLVRDARIASTLPQLFYDVRPGERVIFDDGKISGAITSVSTDEIRVTITRAAAGGTKLGADKGINLPDSTLHLPGLTDKDRADLSFIAQHADIVQLSFAEDPGVVAEVQNYLAAHSKRQLGIVLKIETRRGFERLPTLLLAAMRSYPVGVMIARGDLAVECGFERMAEVQEEVLWLCEAAHVPVIWATQVLETLAKRGMPTRAEITDAAMGERAECVMLSKGPYLLEAVAALDNILKRMQSHQRKKTALLRELQVCSSL